jgi:hypothetical protein
MLPRSVRNWRRPVKGGVSVGGRTDEVREHHCDLAAFGRVLRLLLRSGGGVRCHLGRICVLADSGKYLPSGSERDAHVLQILIGQMGEYGNVNLILRVCPDTLGRITEFSKHEPN